MLKVNSLIKIIFVCLIVILKFAFLSAEELSGIIIDNSNNAVDFSNRNVFRINKGDNPEYKNYDYNDKDWAIVSLPSSWDSVFPGWKGICWYRTNIYFPQNHPKNTTGISLGIIHNTDEVYLNGQLIGSTGRFGPEQDYAYDQVRIYELPQKIIKYGEKNVLAVRVSGFLPKESGPIRGVFRIAPLLDLQRQIMLKDFIDVIFAVIYIAVSVYLMTIFLSRSLKKEYLFFSLFVFSSALYMFLRTQFKYLITQNFILLKRFEYVILFFLLFLFLEYITYYFNRKNRLINYIYLVLTFVNIIPVLLIDNIIIWTKILFYIYEPAALIVLGYCMYIAIKESGKRPDSIYLIAALPVMTVFFINDILADRGLWDFPRLTNYGFIVIITGAALMMRSTYFTLYNELESIKAKKIKYKTSVTDESRESIEKSIEYLKENYTSNISREGLAASVNMNPDYFGKKFKNYTGVSFNDYINQLRIAHALKLLADESRSVTDIAFAVGFESLSTFYRIFSEITGKTPAAYKDGIK